MGSSETVVGAKIFKEKKKQKIKSSRERMQGNPLWGFHRVKMSPRRIVNETPQGHRAHGTPILYYFYYLFSYYPAYSVKSFGDAMNRATVK